MAPVALEEYVAESEVANDEIGLAGQVAEEIESSERHAEEVSWTYPAIVEGFCRHMLYERQCPNTALDCFTSKERGCSFAKEYEKTRSITRYLAGQIKEARDAGKDVSQLTYYVKLVRERLSEWKLPNSTLYNKIIIEKLNSI